MKQLLFFLMISFHVKAQVMWQVRSDTVYKWYYKDGDEFNSVALDETKWFSGIPWGNFILSQDLYFTSDNIILADGIIQFMASNKPRTFPITANKQDSATAAKNGKPVRNSEYTVNHTAGLIASRTKYKYGYFELRFKSTSEKGIWPAFWLYGGNPNEEIDFFELKGEKKQQAHLDVHCPIGCDDFRGGFLNLEKNWGGWVKLKENLADHWNIISGEWQPGYVKFFLNGQPIAYFKGDFKMAQTLFINTSVAKDGEAFNPGPDVSTQWPNFFSVDYVRIWSREDTMSFMPHAKLFEKTNTTVLNNDLVSNELEKRKKFLYSKQNLEPEKGTITLLPLGNNKYSLSICGKALGAVELSISGMPVSEKNPILFVNTEYALLDYSDFPPGKYIITLRVKSHTIAHDILVR